MGVNWQYLEECGNATGPSLSSFYKHLLPVIVSDVLAGRVGSDVSTRLQPAPHKDEASAAPPHRPHPADARHRALGAAQHTAGSYSQRKIHYIREARSYAPVTPSAARRSSQDPRARTWKRYRKLLCSIRGQRTVWFGADVQVLYESESNALRPEPASWRCGPCVVTWSAHWDRLTTVRR